MPALAPPPPGRGPRPLDALMLDSPGALGPLVHSVRHARGLSRQELAEPAGVGRRFVYDLERGKPSLRFDKMYAVMRVLGIVAMVMDAASARTAPPPG